MLINGVKRTIHSHYPSILIVDLDVIADAPAEMNVSGYGDLLATWTAPVDWYLANVLAMQDAVLSLLEGGKADFCSATSLSLSEPALARLLGRLDDYKGRIILRDSEISNSPEVIRRLGLIAMTDAAVAALVRYGETRGLTAPSDRRYVTNRLLQLLKQPDMVSRQERERFSKVTIWGKYPVLTVGPR